MLFLKPNSLDNFGHTTNTLTFFAQQMLSAAAAHRGLCYRLGFFPGLICYKNSKTPPQNVNLRVFDHINEF